MYCDHCGENIPLDISICPKCGTQLAAIEVRTIDVPVKKERSLTIRILSCSLIFFGFTVVKVFLKWAGIGGLVFEIPLLFIFLFLIRRAWAKR